MGNIFITLRRRSNTFKMNFVGLFLLFFLQLCGVSNAAYPTTYPFDKELDLSTPPAMDLYSKDDTKLGDASDTGGYYARLMHCDPYSDQRLSIVLNQTGPNNLVKGPGFVECRANSYFHSHIKKTKNKNLGTKNCTEQGQAKYLVPFDAKYGSTSLCTSCCKGNIDGSPNDWGSGEKNWIKAADKWTSAGCPAPDKAIAEALVCTAVWQAWGCRE